MTGLNSDDWSGWELEGTNTDIKQVGKLKNSFKMDVKSMHFLVWRPK